jgi:hypothetical protein
MKKRANITTFYWWHCRVNEEFLKAWWWLCWYRNQKNVVFDQKCGLTGDVTSFKRSLCDETTIDK